MNCLKYKLSYELFKVQINWVMNWLRYELIKLWIVQGIN